MIIHKNYIRQVHGILRTALVCAGLGWSSFAFGGIAQAQQQRYGVYVNTNNPLLLEIVQQIQPGAIFRKYDGRTVIEAGTFFSGAQAEQLAEILAWRGIDAEITDFEDGIEFRAPVNPIPVLVALPRAEIDPIETQIPRLRPLPNQRLSLFMVLVSAEEAVISEVQKFSADSFVQQYKGKLLIQAGSFINLQSAERLVAELALRGIPAEIVSTEAELDRWIAKQPDIPVSISAIAGDLNFGLTSSESYFVLIPAAASDLLPVAKTAVNLGVPEKSIMIQDLATEPFVAVGPFSNEALANEWENYLNQSGLSGARVYFGR